MFDWRGWLAIVVLISGASGARAETEDEIALLARKGLGAEVLLAAVERSPGFQLDTEKIVKLKESGVPDAVIVAMLKKKPGVAAPAPVVQAPVETSGTFSLENVDSKAWAFSLNQQAQLVAVMPAGSSDQATLLDPHSGATLTVPPGIYEVRYTGDDTPIVCNVRAGERTLVLLSRVATADFEGLYASVFERGEKKGGGRLAVLRQSRKLGVEGATYERAAAAEPPAQTVSATAPSVPAVPVAPSYEYAPPRVETRIIERDRVYVEPASTVVYRVDPVTYYPSGFHNWTFWPAPRFGHPVCYPLPSSHLYYRHHNHKSNLRIGFGVSF